MEHFQLVEEWCEVYAPDLGHKIQPVEIEGDEVLFDSIQAH